MVPFRRVAPRVSRLARKRAALSTRARQLHPHDRGRAGADSVAARRFRTARCGSVHAPPRRTRAPRPSVRGLGTARARRLRSILVARRGVRMIDAATADALSRVASRARDLLQGYRGGFEPVAGDATIRGTAAAPSLDPLSVVAPQGTFFVTRTPDGTPLLTRDGAFGFVDGELRASDGSIALGTSDATKTLTAAAHRSPRRCPRPCLRTAHRSRWQRLLLRSAVDPRNGERRDERVCIGRLTLARLPAGTLPERVDATHVRAPRGVLPLVGRPADGTFAPLDIARSRFGAPQPGRRLQRLQEAYLSLEALLSAHHARGTTEKRRWISSSDRRAALRRRPARGRPRVRPALFALRPRCRFRLPASSRTGSAKISRSSSAAKAKSSCSSLSFRASKSVACCSKEHSFAACAAAAPTASSFSDPPTRRTCSLAFGETDRSPAAPLSELERETLGRLLNACFRRACRCAERSDRLAPNAPT